MALSADLKETHTMLLNPARHLVALLLPLLLVAPLGEAQAGTFANPDLVSVGTNVLITGNGFDGGKRPKVFADRAGEQKRVIFQVLSWSPTTIVALVKKVPSSKTDPAAGKGWNLRIQPRGPSAGELISAGTITTVAPRVLSVVPASGSPGDEVTVLVQDTGSKKPKVLVNGRKAKVLDVSVAGAEGAVDVKQFVVRLPNTHNGFFAVQVENALGHNPSNQLVEITGSSRKWPGNRILSTVDGLKYNVKSKKIAAGSSNGEVTIQGEAGKLLVRELFLRVPFNVSLDSPPASFVGGATDGADFGYGEQPFGGLASGWASTDDSFEFIVNAAKGRRLQVSFDGVLLEQEPAIGQQPTTRRVKGTTYITLQPTLTGSNTMTGAKQNPPVATAATGTADIVLDTATNQLSWNITHQDLSSPETKAHFHGPANESQNGSVQFNLNLGTPKIGSTTLTPEQALQVENGMWYVNIHTELNDGDGEIRAQLIVQ
jgi:hypothetical protein